MKVICFLAFMLMIFPACQQEQMLKPVTDDLLTPNEDKSSEEQPLEIPVDFSDIDVSPPTIPESADITNTDYVSHYDDLSESTTLEDWNPHNFVFETAEDAVSDDNIIGYFETVKAWAEEQCGSKDWVQTPELHVFFTSREERSKFYDALPGGWDFWTGFGGVIVIRSKDVYYMSSIQPLDACKFADLN